jgi:hypothetical protein
VATKLTVVALLAKSSPALTLVAKTLAADIKLVTSKVEAVTPVASRDPVLAAVATKLTVVAFEAKSSPALTLVAKTLAADIKLVTSKVEAVIPDALRDPVLAAVATKLTVVALEAKSSPALTLVTKILAADIKLVTSKEEAVTPPASRDPVLAAEANKLTVVALLANRFAAEIRLVTSKVEAVTPAASRLPVLAAVDTKLVAVAFDTVSSLALILVANKLAADIKLVTSKVEVVTPAASKLLAVTPVAVTVCRLLEPLAIRVPVEILFSIKFTEVIFTAVTVPPTNRSPASLTLPDTSILPVVIEYKEASPLE